MKNYIFMLTLVHFRSPVKFPRRLMQYRATTTTIQTDGPSCCTLTGQKRGSKTEITQKINGKETAMPRKSNEKGITRKINGKEITRKINGKEITRGVNEAVAETSNYPETAEVALGRIAGPKMAALMTMLRAAYGNNSLGFNLCVTNRLLHQ